MSAAACPSCGAPGQPGAVRCGRCGAALYAAPYPASTATAPTATAPWGPAPAAPPQPAYGPAYGAAGAPASPPPYAPPYAPAYAPPYGYGAVPGYASPPSYGAPPFYAPPYFAPPMYAPAFMMPLTPAQRMQGLASAASGARTSAAVIDFACVFALWLFLFFVVYPPVFGPWNGFFPPHLEVRIPLSIIAVFLYYGLQDGLGGTLGKRLVALRLVDERGQAISFARGLGRALEALVWIGLMVFSIVGVIVALVLYSHLMNNGSQGIGDRIARCYLVRRRDLAAAGA